jgi:hypothetical protein
MNYNDFASIDFPLTEASVPSDMVNVVYIFCFVANDSEIPFYVGETGRFVKRMKDYKDAYFTASTDFRIGEAAKFLGKRYHVVVRYGPSSPEKWERKKQERVVIRELVKSGKLLLNCFPGYEQGSADVAEERSEVQSFCEMLISPVTNGTN